MVIKLKRAQERLKKARLENRNNIVTKKCSRNISFKNEQICQKELFYVQHNGKRVCVGAMELLEVDKKEYASLRTELQGSERTLVTSRAKKITLIDKSTNKIKVGYAGPMMKRKHNRVSVNLPEGINFSKLKKSKKTPTYPPTKKNRQGQTGPHTRCHLLAWSVGGNDSNYNITAEHTLQNVPLHAAAEGVARELISETGLDKRNGSMTVLATLDEGIVVKREYAIRAKYSKLFEILAKHSKLSGKRKKEVYYIIRLTPGTGFRPS
jgi:hypothetical protein